MRQTFEQLRVAGNAAILPVAQRTKEPRISLPDKFDGNRSKFRGFVNQVQIVLQLQHECYPIEASRVGFPSTLLSGSALSWFAPLLEKNSPLLQDFDNFLMEFNNTFGETDKVRTATTKIRALRQGSRPASIYAAEF